MEQCSVRVAEHRTARDVAEELRRLVDEEYPDAAQIVLITDNLNTHPPGCLYERFAPEEARRIARKIEWHYTPEHGSWLNTTLRVPLGDRGVQALGVLGPVPEPAHRRPRDAGAGGECLGDSA